ncbi:hypothetical protein AN643_00045 [Candidatus Epulonipiscioides saccharophilum]|nr:hypothetical protein AN643_00045 [Epulopiscium sp. SCG-B10WGA-EpuloB]
MNITMMTNNYKPFVGGVPISIERLTDGLSHNGHNVHIFAPTYIDQVEEKNVIRYRSSKKAFNNMAMPHLFDFSIIYRFL